MYVAIDRFVPYEGHLGLDLVVWSTDNVQQLVQLTAEHILYRVGVGRPPTMRFFQSPMCDSISLTKTDSCHY